MAKAKTTTRAPKAPKAPKGADPDTNSVRQPGDHARNRPGYPGDESTSSGKPPVNPASDQGRLGNKAHPTDVAADTDLDDAEGIDLEDEETPTRDLGPMIRVIATRTGFVDNVRRRPDDVFDVHEKEFSKKWMRKVKGVRAGRPTGPKAHLQKFHDETLAGRTAARTLEPDPGDPLGANSTSPRA